MNLFGVFQNGRRKQKGEDDDVETDNQETMARALPRNHRRPRSKIARSRQIKNADYSPGEAYSDGFLVRGETVSDLEGSRGRSREIQTISSLISPASHYSHSSETSFRISGEANGQFAVLCRSLGVSDPEDFAITPADWIAAKMESSSPFSGDHGNNCNATTDQGTLEFDRNVAIPSSSCTPDADSDCVRDFCSRSVSNGRGGIKGTRPSSLTPPPPMSLPDAKKFSSTWDLVKSLAPDEGKNEIPLEFEKEKERKEEKDANLAELDATCTDLTSSCSLWTSNDEDSLTTTPDTISPNIKCKFHISPGSWKKGELLGHGSFGSVYEAFSDDGIFFAAKEVSLLDICPNGQECIQQLEKEIELLSQFQHENIVEYFGTAKEEGKLYIFLEYMTKGSLASLYQKFELGDSHVSAYTRQILHGMKYLHDRNIIHRDIKCANILVAANGSVKLADFGLAKQTTQSMMLRSSKGTIFWMAPEVLNHLGSYGISADIWSLGCTVLEMLTRNHPFPDLDWVQAIYHIGGGGQPNIPESVSTEARDFISQCIRVNPMDRPSAADLLHHPFVKRPAQTSSSSVFRRAPLRH